MCREAVVAAVAGQGVGTSALRPPWSVSEVEHGVATWELS